MSEIRLHDSNTSKTLKIYTDSNIKKDVNIQLPTESGTVLTDTNINSVLLETSEDLMVGPILKPSNSGSVINQSGYDGYLSVGAYKNGEVYIGEHEDTHWVAALDPKFENIIDTSFGMKSFVTSWRPRINTPSTKVYVKYRFISGLMASRWSDVLEYTTPEWGVKMPNISIEYPTGDNLLPKFILDGFNIYGTSNVKHIYTNWKLREYEPLAKEFYDTGYDSMNDHVNLYSYALPTQLNPNTLYVLEVSFGLDNGTITETTRYELLTSDVKVNTPTIDFIVDEAKLYLECSPFSMSVGTAGHSYTSWVIKNQTGGIVLNTPRDYTNLDRLDITDITMPKQTYTATVRYTGATDNIGLTDRKEYYSGYAEYTFTTPELIVSPITGTVVTGANGLPELSISKYIVGGNKDTIKYCHIEMYNNKTNAKIYEEDRPLTPDTDGNLIKFNSSLSLNIAPAGMDIDLVDREYTIHVYKAGDIGKSNVLKLPWRLEHNILVPSQPVLSGVEVLNPKVTLNAIQPTGANWITEKGIEVKLFNNEETNKTLIDTTIVNSANGIYTWIKPNTARLEIDKKYKIEIKGLTNWLSKKVGTLTFTAPNVKIDKPVCVIEPGNEGVTLDYNLRCQPATFTGGVLTHDRTEIKILDAIGKELWTTTVNRPNNLLVHKLPLSVIKPETTYTIKVTYITDGGMRSPEWSGPLTTPTIKLNKPEFLGAIITFKYGVIQIDDLHINDNGMNRNIRESHSATTWRVYNDKGQLIKEVLKDRVNKTYIYIPDLNMPSSVVDTEATIKVIMHSDNYGDTLEAEYKCRIEYTHNIPDNIWDIKAGNLRDGAIFGDVPTNLVAPTCPEHNHEIAIREYCGEWGYETNFRKPGSGNGTGPDAHHPYKKGDRISYKGKYYECLVDQPWGTYNPSTEPTKWKEVIEDFMLPSTVEICNAMGLSWDLYIPVEKYQAEPVITEDDICAEYEYYSSNRSTYQRKDMILAYLELKNNNKYTKILSPSQYRKRICYISTEPVFNMPYRAIEHLFPENTNPMRHEHNVKTYRFGTGLYYIRTADKIEISLIGGYAGLTYFVIQPVETNKEPYRYSRPFYKYYDTPIIGSDVAYNDISHLIYDKFTDTGYYTYTDKENSIIIYANGERRALRLDHGADENRTDAVIEHTRRRYVLYHEPLENDDLYRLAIKKNMNKNIDNWYIDYHRGAAHSTIIPIDNIPPASYTTGSVNHQESEYFTKIDDGYRYSAGNELLITIYTNSIPASIDVTDNFPGSLSILDNTGISRKLKNKLLTKNWATPLYYPGSSFQRKLSFNHPNSTLNIALKVLDTFSFNSTLKPGIQLYTVNNTIDIRGIDNEYVVGSYKNAETIELRPNPTYLSDYPYNPIRSRFQFNIPQDSCHLMSRLNDPNVNLDTGIKMMQYITDGNLLATYHVAYAYNDLSMSCEANVLYNICNMSIKSKIGPYNHKIEFPNRVGIFPTKLIETSGTTLENICRAYENPHSGFDCAYYTQIKRGQNFNCTSYSLFHNPDLN